MSAGVLAVRSRSMSVLVALALALFGLAVLPATAHAAAGDPDTTFNAAVGSTLNNWVRSFAVQGDDRVVGRIVHVAVDSPRPVQRRRHAGCRLQRECGHAVGHLGSHRRSRT